MESYLLASCKTLDKVLTSSHLELWGTLSQTLL